MNTQQSSQSNPVFGPYSPIRQAGDLYFVSGQVGVDPSTKIAPHTITEQTHVALSNLKAVLETVGLDLEHVVKTTIFVTDMGNFAAVNEVYMSYFSDPRPARSTVAAKELPRVASDTQVMVEIEAIAYGPEGARP